MENNGKFALVTGASTGIGFELAKLFAKNQYNLVLIARNQNELDTAKAKIRSEHEVEIHTMACDLSDRQGPFEVYEEVKAKGIKVNVLVNNAGQGEFGEFVHTDIHRELEIIQLNIGAYVVLTKLFVKDMLSRNEGKILNVGSIAGEIPGPWQSVYHGTKAFVNSWTEAIRSELKDTSLVITLLLPGVTDTEFFAKANMESSKMVQENDLADPAKVAQDGFEALMAGDDKVTSGLKNKAMVAMSHVMPESMVADNMKKQQKPIDKKE
jgi:short-subunit dehydrogenase